jgi:hypothetical protein
MRSWLLSSMIRLPRTRYDVGTQTWRGYVVTWGMWSEDTGPPNKPLQPTPAAQPNGERETAGSARAAKRVRR